MTELQLEALLRAGKVALTGGRGMGKTATAAVWLAQQNEPIHISTVNQNGVVKEVINAGEPHTLEIKAKGKKGTQKMSEGKAGLHFALKALCQKHGIPLFEEQRFHPTRKWRLDYLLPVTQWGVVAVEYEGLVGFGRPGGHTTSDAYSDNTQKYNAAAFAGITVIRYTYANWGQAVVDLEMFFL